MFFHYFCTIIIAKLNKPAVKKKSYSGIMDAYRQSPIYIPYANSLMRYTLSKKAQCDIQRIKKRYSEKDDIVKRWFNHRKIFFGLGFFRSGTTFLADFLNRNLEEVIVQHEPNLIDYYYFATAIQNPAGTYDYIREYRLREIYDRMQCYGIKAYGEINPFLGRHCDALKQLCPEAKQFHMVRDGRDVLRSLMTRKFFGPNHFWTTIIHPPQGDDYLERWKSITPFEKICWLWKSDNEYLRNHIPHRINFETLVTDYDYFKTSLTDYLELDAIAPDIWQRDIGKRKNHSPKHSFPHFNDWNNQEKKMFEKICGEEMLKSGYQL